MQPALQDLLGVVIKMNNLEATQKILGLMKKESECGHAGIWFEPHLRHIVSANRAFEWLSIETFVIGVVKNTAPRNIHHCTAMLHMMAFYNIEDGDQETNSGEHV